MDSRKKSKIKRINKGINKKEITKKMNIILKKQNKKYFRLKALCLFFILSSTLFSGCAGKNAIAKKRTGIYFDTVITITLYGNDEKYFDKCFELCDQYEKMFSTTVSESEIACINQNSKNGIYTTVSDETIELLKLGLKYSELSDGRFDITIGRLTSLWNFSGQSPENCIPSSKELSESIKDIGYDQINITGNKVLITNPNVSIDLGGIAKGLIADKLKEYLTAHNVKKGIINLGGNVLLIGSKPDGSNFNIGIQKPFATDGKMIAIVNTSDKSIVTSGVYERYFYQDDVLYHHILDVSTGYPVSNDLLSVTVISDNSVDGDGLSTTAFILGLDDGMEMIESIGNVEAVFVDKNNQIFLTSGLGMSDNVISIDKN